MQGGISPSLRASVGLFWMKVDLGKPFPADLLVLATTKRANVYFYISLVLPHTFGTARAELLRKVRKRASRRAHDCVWPPTHQTSSSFSAIYSCASMSCSVRATHSSPPNGLWRRVTSLLIRRVDLNRSQADCLRQGLKRCFGVHGKLAVGRKGSERELSLLRTKRRPSAGDQVSQGG